MEASTRRGYVSIAGVLLLSAVIVVVVMTSNPKTDQHSWRVADASVDIEELAVDTCCPSTSLVGGSVAPAGQSISSSGLQITAPNVGFVCSKGASIKTAYPACATLPLDASTRFEALVIDSSFTLNLAGMIFKPDSSLLPSVCFVQSPCTGSWAFTQDGLPLEVTIAKVLTLTLRSVMVSALGKISLTSATGLWKGSGTTIGAPVTMTGHAFIAADLSIGFKLSKKVASTVEFGGNLLFALDAGITLDKVFAQLASGDLDFDSASAPGFQLTANVVVAFEIALPGFPFALSLGAGTVTLGMNMAAASGGFSNGIYACAVASLSVGTIIPPLKTAFPCLAWPEFQAASCFYFNAGGFGFLRSFSLSMFGASVSASLAVVLKSSTGAASIAIALAIDTWIFELGVEIGLALPTFAPSAEFTLKCGNTDCATRIMSELSSEITAVLEDTAKDTLKNLFTFEGEDATAELSAEGAEGTDGGFEDLLEVHDSDAVEEQLGWKKAAKKSTKAVSKTATKAVKTVAAALPSFKFEAPVFKISALTLSGSPCEGVMLKYDITVGAKITGKTYSTTQRAEIAFNAGSATAMKNAILDNIPNPF